VYLFLYLLLYTLFQQLKFFHSSHGLIIQFEDHRDVQASVYICNSVFLDIGDCVVYDTENTTQFISSKEI